MLITTLALEKCDKSQACIPVSIEHGYDLLTPIGRRKAEIYIKHEKPDLLVGEWMCGPFSSMQNINLNKGPELRNQILKAQREHAKVSAWISKMERWQRNVNKGHWLGDYQCASVPGGSPVRRKCKERTTTPI